MKNMVRSHIWNWCASPRSGWVPAGAHRIKDSWRKDETSGSLEVRFRRTICPLWLSGQGLQVKGKTIQAPEGELGTPGVEMRKATTSARHQRVHQLSCWILRRW